MVSYNPETCEASLIAPEGVTRPFLDSAPFVHLQQRGRWLVAQDGVNIPVVMDGDAARFDRNPFGGIPAGTLMADGWNRLAVVSPDRQRVYLSDHEMDPTSHPLAFSEGASYYLNARYFQTPRELGRIVAVAFAPSFNYQDDLGPLVVFCERGTRAYAIQHPREEWAARDIAATMLPTVGACAHGAVVARGNDMVFSDHDGRVQTFRSAVSRRDSARVAHIDAPVRELYAKEDASLRRWRVAERFDNRVLVSVWPERVRRARGVAIRHRGFVVMEEETLSERPFVWAGLWTGILPVAINVVGHQPSPLRSPEERCFAVSLDEDGVNRLYEIDRESGHDMMPDPRRVPMWVFPRWMDWKTAFDAKRLHGASVRLGPVKGRVVVQGWWQTLDRGPSEWFVHHDAGPECLSFGGDGLRSSASVGRPRVNLPSPSSREAFYSVRPFLKVSGRASIREFALHGELQQGSQGNDTVCVPPASASFRGDCRPDFWKHESVPAVPPPVHASCASTQ